MSTTQLQRPTWSPDGRRLAFLAHTTGPPDPSDRFDIYVVNVTGGGLTNVTNNRFVLNPCGAGTLFTHTWNYVYNFPDWSPAGTIAFLREDNTTFCVDSTAQAGIFTMTLWTGAVKRLTNGWAWYLSWSPDGRRLAFVVATANSIATVNADGSGEKKLLVTNKPIRWLTWLPNGRRIVFFDSTGEIYTVNANGGDVRKFGGKYIGDWAR